MAKAKAVNGAGTYQGISDILSGAYGQQGQDPYTQRLALAMLTGANLESNMNPTAVQPGGQGRGLFQIDLGAHPNVTQAQAFNPQWAVSFMKPAYEAAMSKVNQIYGANIWNTNPQLAAEQTAYYAEKPASDYYASQGNARVANAYAMASREAQIGPPVNVPSTWQQVGTAAGTAVGDVGGAMYNGGKAVGKVVTNPMSVVNFLGKIAADVSDPSFWLRVGFVVLGFIFVVISVKGMTGGAEHSQLELNEAPPNEEPIPGEPKHGAEHITEHAAEMAAS